MNRPTLHRFRRRDRRDAALWLGMGFIAGLGLLAIAYAEYLHKTGGL